MEVRAAAYIVKNDGSVRQVFGATPPLSRHQREACAEWAADVDIIGAAERAVAIPEDLPTPKQRDYSLRRGDEAYVSGQLFAVRLSAKASKKAETSSRPVCRPCRRAWYRLRIAALSSGSLAPGRFGSADSQPPTSLIRAISSAGPPGGSTRCGRPSWRKKGRKK